MKTAVEWLVSQLNKEGFAQVVTDEELEQAKEMEKEQIEDAYRTGWINYLPDKDSKEYYNQTFKSE